MKLAVKFKSLYEGPRGEGIVFDAIVTVYKRREGTREIQQDGQLWLQHQFRHFVTIDLWFFKLRFEQLGGWHDSVEQRSHRY